MDSKSTYNRIIESRLLYEVGSVFKKHSDRKLRFYEAGIVVYPVKYLGKIALREAFVEVWNEIEKYRFDKPVGLYKNASKGIFEKTDLKGLDYCLHIETSGIFPRCVNRYGMSAFGLMGFLLSDKQTGIIQGIFESFGIAKDSDSTI